MIVSRSHLNSFSEACLSACLFKLLGIEMRICLKAGGKVFAFPLQDIYFIIMLYLKELQHIIITWAFSWLAFTLFSKSPFIWSVGLEESSSSSTWERSLVPSLSTSIYRAKHNGVQFSPNLWFYTDLLNLAQEKETTGKASLSIK